MNKILEGNVVTAVMTFITIYALWGDDIRILVSKQRGDPVWWGFNCVAMLAFTIEFVCLSIA